MTKTFAAFNSSLDFVPMTKTFAATNRDFLRSSQQIAIF